MQGLWWTCQIFLALVVAALSANLFYDGGHGFGYAISPLVYQAVALAVLAVPVFWAGMHLCGGIVMGMAAGGLLDGIKLGLMLGLGMALSKMWPYVAGAALGVWAGGGPLVYIIGGVVLAAVLFGLDRALVYFWQHFKAGGTA